MHERHCTLEAAKRGERVKEERIIRTAGKICIPTYVPMPLVLPQVPVSA